MIWQIDIKSVQLQSVNPAWNKYIASVVLKCVCDTLGLCRSETETHFSQALFVRTRDLSEEHANQEWIIAQNQQPHLHALTHSNAPEPGMSGMLAVVLPSSFTGGGSYSYLRS